MAESTTHAYEVIINSSFEDLPIRGLCKEYNNSRRSPRTVTYTIKYHMF